jgi:hypothetical protein
MSGTAMSEDDVVAWFAGDFAEAKPLTAGPHVLASLPATGDIAVARGLLTGRDVDKALQDMIRLKQRFGGSIDPKSLNDSDLEEYLAAIKNKPELGVTTVATVALRKSQWTPKPGDNKNVPDKFIKYLDILSKAPCMEVVDVSDQSVSYREQNYSELIKKAADLLKQGIEGDVDVTRIVDSLTSLAQGLTTSVKKTDSICVLSQNAIPLEPARPGYLVYLTQATMKLSKDGKAEVYESTLTVYWMKLRFSTEMWTSGFYRVIGKQAYEDAHDWFEAIDTPIPAGAPRLCF